MSTENLTAPAASIGDNYTEYLDEECGFAYDIAEQMTRQDIATQDAIIQASPQELRAIEDAMATPENGLHLWMLARAWEQAGEMDRYFDLCARLLAAEDAHPLVIYPEISRRVARQHALAGDFERAQQRLRAHQERWADDAQAQQLAALIGYLASPEADDSALRALVAKSPQDAEIRFEIAEDLWLFERPDAAAAWLDEASEVARQFDPATLVDVELLRARMARAGAST